MSQAVMARQDPPVLPLMTCGNHLSNHHCSVHSSSGRLHSGGIDSALLDQLVIYLFAVGGFGFSVLFSMWQAAVIHDLFVILTRK